VQVAPRNAPADTGGLRRLLDAHRGVHYDERLFRLQTTLQ
jgi:hypothetical protein